MSDFDKEKEREKLREKYERDEEKRETAEKMSELLLQGATMTNAHCSECGDPIFRYDGQEFCATCERTVQRATGEGGDTEDEANADAATEAADDEASTDDQQIEMASPSDEARVAFGDADGQPDGVSDQSGTGPERGPASTGPAQPSSGRQDVPEREQIPQSPAAESDESVAQARASLTRTLTRFSQQAETTEDPQRAQEYLAAAREAAEALAALRR